MKKLIIIMMVILLTGCRSNEIKYVVDFETGDGTKVESVELYENQKLSSPVDPTMKGYVFEGWYSDQDCTNKFNFEGMLSSDVTLYAKWEKSLALLIDEYLLEQGLHGAFGVYENEKEIYKGAFGEANREEERLNDTETIFLIGSISKQFTAVSILMLEERGLLSLEDTLDMYIHDYPNGNLISIHHLLTHSSGIPEYTDEFPWNTDGFSEIIHSINDLIDSVKYKPLEFTPGEKCSYSNTNYVILAYIMEQVTGDTFNEYVQSNIFNVLGMNNTGIYSFMEQSNMAKGYLTLTTTTVRYPATFHSSFTTGTGSIASNISDMYRWHKALTEYELITKESTDKMYNNNIVYDEDFMYGYGWFIFRGEDTLVVDHPGAISGFRSYFYRDLEEDIVVVFFSNKRQEIFFEVTQEVLKIMNEYQSSED